jgi:hypothetical protein
MKAVMKMNMKLSTYSACSPKSFNCFQQIAVHVGGMTRALLRHYPINWTFHWRGICRAISSQGLTFKAGEMKSSARAVEGAALP